MALANINNIFSSIIRKKKDLSTNESQTRWGGKRDSRVQTTSMSETCTVDYSHSQNHHRGRLRVSRKHSQKPKTGYDSKRGILKPVYTSTESETKSSF
ncbi:hypothetical protein OIU79_015647 [Salix purpurea]|uniref:Uncharacterized protein n=1 Tax=Salix purpurea TaxID=77065 RepID=A0A9Q0SPT5_SALPP|nr:hypothetical protein OIU79_015647 [Salix purpurea]